MCCWTRATWWSRARGSTGTPACARLADGGYHAVSTVEDPGTFAVRGGIIDVFPPHLDDPVRIELWGDDVDSVKPFRVDSQRTYGGSLESLMLPPVREELLVPPYRDNARTGILEAGAAAGVPSRKLQPLLADLSNGMPFMGIEGFRPAFYEQLGVLTDYLPAEAVLLLLDPLGVSDKIRGVNELREREYADSLRDQMPALPADRHVQHLGELQRFFAARPCVRAHVLHIGGPPGQVVTGRGGPAGGGGPDLGDDLLDLSDEPLKYEGPEGAIRFQVPNNRDLTHALGQARSDKEPLRPLAVAARDWSDLGACVLIACRQETQLDRLERVLKGYGVRVRRATGAPREYLHPPGSEAELGAVLVQGEVGGGFRLLEHGFALLTEDEIFGKKSHKRRKSARSDDATSPFVQSFRELEPGDFVVHSDHGVGKYLGLKKLVVGTNETDFLVVEFAGADKLYLPVYKLGRLQKYVGPSENGPKIDKLGGTGWEKVRAKAEKSAEEDAYALLELYARRELAEGTAFTAPDDYFRSFEATFPFDETPDQARAIEEVLEDMQRARPMDRLLCGDVGFGKTEVALRAAMKAVVDAKQVAMLVPTTVLALQHFKTFKERFSQYPVRVELLSRGVHADQQKEVIKDIKLGRVDIVVGTHRVLSKDIVFRDLGLLVLDEEHRFGVKDKERLKEMRSNVDVLTMTATPIPRTLQLSLGGVRDLSVITTPPADRLSVRTYVCRQTDQVVREAIIRELARGGQVFFVHNRVQTIESRKAWLQALVPEAASWSATARWTRTNSKRSCSTSPRASTTCCSRRRSSRAASTSPTPTRCSSTTPTTSASPSSTSSAGASAAARRAVTATCWWPARARSPAMPANASASSRSSPNSAAGSRWPATTSRSAAPASSSARARRARSPPWAWTSTRSSCRTPCSACAASRPRSTSTPRSACRSRHSCPRTTSPTRICVWSCTSAWPMPTTKRTSSRWPRRWSIGSGRCPVRSRTSSRSCASGPSRGTSA